MSSITKARSIGRVHTHPSGSSIKRCRGRQHQREALEEPNRLLPDWEGVVWLVAGTPEPKMLLPWFVFTLVLLPEPPKRPPAGDGVEPLFAGLLMPNIPPPVLVLVLVFMLALLAERSKRLRLAGEGVVPLVAGLLGPKMLTLLPVPALVLLPKPPEPNPPLLLKPKVPADEPEEFEKMPPDEAVEPFG